MIPFVFKFLLDSNVKDSEFEKYSTRSLSSPVCRAGAYENISYPG